MEGFVYLNGEYVPRDQAVISVEDRGFLFADALYEVARIYNGKPFLLDRHIARMSRGAAELRLDHGHSEADFARIIDELVRRNGTADASAYMQVSRGPAPRAHGFPEAVKPTVVVWLKPVTAMTMEKRLAGCTCITHPDLRYAYCSIKSVRCYPTSWPARPPRRLGRSRPCWSGIAW